MAGIERSINFDVGITNIPVGEPYKVYQRFNRWYFWMGEVPDLAIQNSTGFHPIGTDIRSVASMAIDFNTSQSSNQTTVVIPWIPDKIEQIHTMFRW